MGSNETAPLPAISTRGRCSTIPSARRMSKQARNVSTVCVLGRADVSSITAQMTSQPKPAGGRVKAMQHETRSDLCSAWAMSSSRSSRPWSRLVIRATTPYPHACDPARRTTGSDWNLASGRPSAQVTACRRDRRPAEAVWSGADGRGGPCWSGPESGWGEHPIARLGRPQPGGGDRPTTFMDKVVMP